MGKRETLLLKRVLEYMDHEADGEVRSGVSHR